MTPCDQPLTRCLALSDQILLRCDQIAFQCAQIALSAMAPGIERLLERLGTFLFLVHPLQERRWAGGRRGGGDIVGRLGGALLYAIRRLFYFGF